MILVTAVLSSCEVFFRNPLVSHATTVLSTTRKIFAVISSPRISDHWKEIAIPKYAAIASISSARFLVNLLLVVSPVVLFLMLDRFIGTDFEKLVFSLEAMAISTVIAVLYVKVRRS